MTILVLHMKKCISEYRMSPILRARMRLGFLSCCHRTLRLITESYANGRPRTNLCFNDATDNSRQNSFFCFHNVCYPSLSHIFPISTVKITKNRPNKL